MSKPVVGIVVWRRGLRTPLGDPEILHALSDHYVAAFSNAGATPLLIPNGRAVDEADVFLDRIDGLAFSGGDDVDPASYGHDATHSRGQDARIDEWELALVEGARRRRMPTLCICRGNQVLNVAHGGTLRQEILGSSDSHPPLSGLSAEEILGFRHDVSLTSGGRLAEIYGTDEIPVNTIHHQAIDELGDGLEVEAVAPDGIVEAVASTDPDWWAIGVQWHPERTGGVDVPLFERFVAEAGG